MKKNNCLKKFIISLVTVTVVSFAALLVFKFTGNEIDLVSVFPGWLLSLLNIILGTQYLLRAIDKDNKKFLSIVFGSMTIRLFVTLLVIVIALLLIKLNDYYFIFSLLFYYFVFLIFEILFFNCRIKHKKTELNDV